MPKRKPKLRNFEDMVSDFGYEITEVPDHFKNNHELGCDVFAIEYLSEYADFYRVVARCGSMAEVKEAILEHAKTHEPELISLVVG